MASDLQIGLYRKNPKFIYLAELMAQQIYPRLIAVLNNLAIEEIVFEKNDSYRSFSLSIYGKLQFFSISGEGRADIFELDFFGKKYVLCF